MNYHRLIDETEVPELLERLKLYAAPLGRVGSFLLLELLSFFAVVLIVGIPIGSLVWLVLHAVPAAVAFIFFLIAVGVTCVATVFALTALLDHLRRVQKR